MQQKEIASIIPVERIQQSIYLIRGENVMLSHDLASLYGVETRSLIQAVKRNISRFPADFMFQLNEAEFENLKSQIVISSWGGRRRSRPYAFTEQGVAMLSSVLRSQRAVEVNIAIMRTFVQFRRILADNKLLRDKIEQMEQELLLESVLKRNRAKRLWARPEVKKARRRANVRREPFAPTTLIHELYSRLQQKEIPKTTPDTTNSFSRSLPYSNA